MFLDHDIDVQIDLDGVPRKKANICSSLGALLDADDLLYELFLCPVNDGSCLERRPRDLQQVPVVTVAYYGNGGRLLLLDVDRSAVIDSYCALDGQVGLVLNLGDLAQHPTA